MGIALIVILGIIAIILIVFAGKALLILLGFLLNLLWTIISSPTFWIIAGICALLFFIF